MKVTLVNAAIGEGLGADVPPVNLTADNGTPTAIAVEGDEQPLLISMMLGGRLRADHGDVLLNGERDLDRLRTATALVDTPWVAEPTAGVALRTIVMEEFSFAGQPSSRRAVSTFLRRHGLEEYGALPTRALPAVERIRLFSELAVIRPGVSMLIVTSPERHGAPAEDWYPSLAHIADRGIAVAIVTDFATASSLISLGARAAEAPTPEELTPES
jgi:ABC-2 type transport system ATP-binding protein